MRTGTCFKAPISDCRCPSSGLEESKELVHPVLSAKNGEGPVLEFPFFLFLCSKHLCSKGSYVVTQHNNIALSVFIYIYVYTSVVVAVLTRRRDLNDRS